MATMLFELAVEMEDGEKYTLVADQRDVAKWEVQSFGWPVSQIEAKAGVGFFRFLAWSASVRQQKTTDEWDAWTKRCVEVTPVEDGESTIPADAGDPGRTAP